VAYHPSAEGNYEYVLLFSQNFFRKMKLLWAAAVLQLGALMGTIAAGIWTDKYSRQSSILVACGRCDSSLLTFFVFFL
jgi:sugar phosphate permease